MHFVNPSIHRTKVLSKPHAAYTGRRNLKDWIENPRVGGSIPSLGTILKNKIKHLRIAQFGVRALHSHSTVLCALLRQLAAIATRLL